MVHLTYRETEKGHGMAEFSSGSVLFAPYDDARTCASGTSGDPYYSSNSFKHLYTSRFAVLVERNNVDL
jgi:hypothetical protein